MSLVLSLSYEQTLNGGISMTFKIKIFCFSLKTIRKCYKLFFCTHSRRCALLPLLIVIFLCLINQSGVGGPVARHTSRRAPRVAEGQRLPASRPQAAHAFVSRLLQEHLQNPHGDGKHLDTPARWDTHMYTHCSICNTDLNTFKCSSYCNKFNNVA